MISFWETWLPVYSESTETLVLTPVSVDLMFQEAVEADFGLHGLTPPQVNLVLQALRSRGFLKAPDYFQNSSWGSWLVNTLKSPILQAYSPSLTPRFGMGANSYVIPSVLERQAEQLRQCIVEQFPSGLCLKEDIKLPSNLAGNFDYLLQYLISCGFAADLPQQQVCRPNCQGC